MKKSALLTRPAPARQDAPFLRRRSRLVQILNGDPAASPLGGAHRLGAPYRVTFDLINQRARSANAPWQEDNTNIPVRTRTFTHSITFFELTKWGALAPVITTVLDDYFSGTAKFIAVRSAHVTSAFQRALAIQDLGTCVPE